MVTTTIRLRFDGRSTAYLSSLRSRWCNPLAAVTLTYLLHCALASCGAVYCNRSCLWVCDSGRVGGRAVSEPYYSQRGRSVCVSRSAFFIYLGSPEQVGHKHRMVVTWSNRSRVGVEQRSNHSQIEAVPTVLGVPGRSLNVTYFLVTKAWRCLHVKWDFSVVHGISFGRMPFLPPPMTHLDTSKSRSQVYRVQVRHLNHWVAAASQLCLRW